MLTALFNSTQVRLFRYALVSCVLGLANGQVASMSFEMAGDTLILSGPVVDDDLVRFRNAVQDKRLRQVLFHQSPGGDAWTGLRLGYEIRAAGLDTLLSGQCASACGYMFLAGVQRRLSDGMPVRFNRLLLHGAWDLSTGKTLPQKAPELATYITKMTAGNFPEALMQKTVNSAQAQDFMEFAITPRMLKMPQPRGVFQCLVLPDQPRDCIELEGFSAMNTGVVTDAQIFALPAELRERLVKYP
jgi:hypothetical protein